MKNLCFKKIFVGVGIAFVLSVIFLLGLTALVYFGDLDDSTVGMLVIGASAVAVFVGAFVLARNIPGGGLVNGLAVGGIYCIILWMLSLLIGDGVVVDFQNLTRIAVILASGMLGGVLGINSLD